MVGVGMSITFCDYIISKLKNSEKVFIGQVDILYQVLWYPCYSIWNNIGKQ